MVEHGFFKRTFTIKGVKNKFLETAQRLNSIHLSILVLDSGGTPKNNTDGIKQELDDVNHRIDDLYGKMEETKVVENEPIIIPQRRNSGAERSQVVNVKVKQNQLGALPALGIAQIKINEASKLYMEGYWEFYGHGREK